MGRRSGRAAARRAAAALESTPKAFEGLDDDERMPDPEPEREPELEPEPEPEAEQEDEVEKEDGSAAEEEAEEEAGNEDDEEQSPKSPSPLPVQIVRRKRLGRPPKNRPPDWEIVVDTPARDSDATPRRRGRGGYRGRGGRKGQPPPAHLPVDKDGNTMDIDGDEVVLPEDPEGETKVDKLGNLLGGRDYRCRTFTVVGRGDRLYMLSTEPARCVGFRDSYLFFTKHRTLFKIIVDDDEKRDMIERDIIPHSYKGRAIGIVTARSVFREFGASIIVGGRRVVDDYEVSKMRAEGKIEGEVADPNDVFDPEKPYNKNQYVAWHGASAVYHSSGPSVPQQNVKQGEAKKRRVNINDVNWQLEHARECSLFNSTLAAFRDANLNGVYDVHTNLKLYPAIMQPTQARFEQIPNVEDEAAGMSESSNFPPLKPQIPRNFLVTDTYLETPPAGILPSSYDVGLRTSPADQSASASADFLAPFRGLGAVSDEIKDLLPEDCRTAFEAAVAAEKEWHSRWGDDKDMKSCRAPTIDKAIVPYSMMQ